MNGDFNVVLNVSRQAIWAKMTSVRVKWMSLLRKLIKTFEAKVEGHEEPRARRGSLVFFKQGGQA